jgi:predicted acylesterase/phospholipase RssA
MTIKHLVFSGGGPIGVKVLGILQHLNKNDIWNIKNIESIYATSIGTAIAVMLTLNYDWEIIRKYCIERPWSDVYKITPEQLFNMYNTMGIFNQSYFDIFFKPLFDAKNIPMNINLAEFYEYTKIDLHFFSVELNKYELHDISHKTHPNIGLIQAVYMSSAIPVLFSPVCFEDTCYIDGGILNNYPLEYCVNAHPEKDEIMAFKNVYVSGKFDKPDKPNIICEESNLFDYINRLSQAIISNISITKEIKIKNEVNCTTINLNFDFFNTTLQSSEFRQELFDDGIQTAVKWIEQHKCDK